MARANTLEKPRQLPTALAREQQELDAFLQQEPIPGPKPWSDEFERAAIAGCAYATPPQVSLRSLGMPSSTASELLSDNPPDTYRSAALALRERLNKASAWCERSLLSRIARAGEDPSRWQANGWILERSHNFSQRYVQQGDIGPSGPATVVNIGQLNLIQGSKDDVPRISWRDDPQVVDALPVASGLAQETK